MSRPSLFARIRSVSDSRTCVAVVGAFVFGLLLYGCRRLCRRVCPTGELLMRTLDVEDIELELDEEAEPLRDPEAASKLLTRPGMIAGTGRRAAKQLLAKSSGSAYAQPRDDGLELERFLDHSDVASVTATPQRHLSPVRYTPAKAAHAATPSTLSEPPAAADAADADDDMWRLWNQTYDHKNSIADPAPAAAPPSQSQKAYQVSAAPPPPPPRRPDPVAPVAPAAVDQIPPRRRQRRTRDRGLARWPCSGTVARRPNAAGAVSRPQRRRGAEPRVARAALVAVQVRRPAAPPPRPR